MKKLFADERHRFSRVEEAEVKKIPENLWTLGYRFSQPFVQDSSVYFIPRGHNTVGVTGGLKVYVHGGAAPEEVIVPAAVFKPMKPVWKEPAVKFLKL